MFEYLVGLHVTDDQLYMEYRKAMLPILEECGGGFRYDFTVSDVLINETENTINRVFIIYFPDRETSEKFFGNSEYLKAKEAFFNKAVDSITIISEYER